MGLWLLPAPPPKPHPHAYGQEAFPGNEKGGDWERAEKHMVWTPGSGFER